MEWLLAAWIAGIVITLGFELLSIGEVSILTVVFLIFSKILTPKEVFSNFSKDVVFLVMFLFPMGEALFKSGFSEFKASRIVEWARGNLKLAVIGLSLFAMFVSAFTTNTGTTLCLLPIAASLARKFSERGGKNDYSTLIYLSLAISASIGGTLTLIGTPPNIIVAGFEKSIGFFDFLKFGLPMALFWLFYLYVAVPKTDVKIELTKPKVDWRVPVVFALLLLAFLFKKYTAFSYASFALLAVAALIFMRVLTVKEVYASIDWNVVFLVWAMYGVSLAMKKTGLLHDIVAVLVKHFSPTVAMVILLALAYVLANFVSHTATTLILAPIIAAMPLDGMKVFWLMALAFSTSVACATPLGTPPNAIVYSAGKLKFKDFFKVGMIILAFAIVELMVLYWGWRWIN